MPKIKQKPDFIRLNRSYKYRGTPRELFWVVKMAIEKRLELWRISENGKNNIYHFKQRR